MEEDRRKGKEEMIQMEDVNGGTETEGFKGIKREGGRKDGKIQTGGEEWRYGRSLDWIRF